MKVNNIYTIGIACIVILIGMFIGPILNKIYFKPSEIVYEKVIIEEKLLNDVEQYMRELMYPAYETVVTLSPQEIEYYNTDLSAINTNAYADFFSFAELDYDKTVLKSLVKTMDGKFNMVFNQFNTSYGEVDFYMAIEDYIPVAIRYVSIEKPEEEQINNAISYLYEQLQNGMGDIAKYVEGIDYLYRKNNGVSKYPLLYSQIVVEQEENIEIPLEGSLWECCSKGEWRVLTDGSNVILISIIGDYTFQIYYDPVINRFAGYSMVLNKSLYN